MSRMGNLFGGDGDGPLTFLGYPSAADPATVEADIAILGAPVATPYAAFGLYAAASPGAVRAAMSDYAGAAGHMDFDVDGPLVGDPPMRIADLGDLEGDPDDHTANRARITGAVCTLVERGIRPVVLGGDDSVPIPVFQAFEGRGPFTVLQVDAHIDWRDEVRGERLGLSSPMRRASEMPWVDRIVQVGARGLGSARRSDYRDALDYGVRFFTAREVHASGIGAALEAIPRDVPLLVSIDCDGLDPAIMPAVLGPSPGGLDYWQVVNLIHGAAERAPIACFDIVEFMAERDTQGLAALLAGRLVCNAIAAMARGRSRARVSSHPAGGPAVDRQ